MTAFKKYGDNNAIRTEKRRAKNMKNRKVYTLSQTVYRYPPTCNKYKNYAGIMNKYL